LKRLFFYLVPIVILAIAILLFAASNSRVLEFLASHGSSYSALRLGHYYNNMNDLEEYDPDLALEWFEEAADLGSVDAHYEIGRLHITGTVRNHSYKTAHVHFRLGSEAGHIGAMHFLATQLELGIGTDQDLPAAERLYSRLIELESEQADLNLVLLYVQNSKEFEPSKVAEAFRKLHDFADGGDLAALIVLGDAYVDGKLVPKDAKRGLALFHRALDTEPEIAHVIIGNYHLSGSGGETDYAKALEHFFKSSELGNPVSYFHLGEMYEHGLGVQNNFHKAADFYRDAIENNFFGALTSLGVLYRNGTGVERDYDEANQLFRRAADLGISGGSANVGWMMIHGWGVPANSKRGLALIEEAAQENDSDGAYYMALLLEEGKLVEKNRERALEFYKISADKGQRLAIAALDRINGQP
jgi:hypothetical protein